MRSAPAFQLRMTPSRSRKKMAYSRACSTSTWNRWRRSAVGSVTAASCTIRRSAQRRAPLHDRAMRPLAALALAASACGGAPVGDGGMPPPDAAAVVDLEPPADLRMPHGPMKLSESGLYADFGA